MHRHQSREKQTVNLLKNLLGFMYSSIHDLDEFIRVQDLIFNTAGIETWFFFLSTLKVDSSLKKKCEFPQCRGKKVIDVENQNVY